MSNFFIVSRHPATIRWLQKNLPVVDGIFAELPVQELQAGDCIYGNLTAHLIAQICESGCRYFHVRLKLPLELRGKELDDQQLMIIQPEIVEIEARTCVQSSIK